VLEMYHTQKASSHLDGHSQILPIIKRSFSSSVDESVDIRDVFGRSGLAEFLCEHEGDVCTYRPMRKMVSFVVDRSCPFSHFN